MKRLLLLKYLAKHGCVFFREGGSHTLYLNPKTQQITTIPRHNEIHEFLAKKICKDLGIPLK